jgi:hypothetical protein
MVSLFASAVRVKLWKYFVDSLGLSLDGIEVIFCGDAKFDDKLFDGKYCKYIKIGRIKPSQCYEIARRHCIGEVIVWVADDCEFKGDIIGKSYKYWKSQNNEKLILSLQTEESGIWQDMNHHRFFGGINETPLMAPIGMASRKFINDLGGLDRRYVAGQYENDLVMRAYAQGAKVEIFGDHISYVEINHMEKSVLSGEITNKQEFENRPFATGYNTDRMILEKSWAKLNETKLFVLLKDNPKEIEYKHCMDILSSRSDEFEPYAKYISLTKSESHKGIWE